METRPDSAFSLYERGVAKSNEGDWNGAIKDYTIAIRLKPDFAEAYNARGGARGCTSDKEGAMLDLNKAIQLKPILLWPTTTAEH